MNFDIVKAAANYVRELGLEDNKEHLAAVDAKGNILFIAHGDDHSVGADGHDFTNVAYIVHNHPNDSSLSVQDIAMSTMNNCTTVAVSRTGSMYASAGIGHEFLREVFPHEDEEGLRDYALGGLHSTDHKVADMLMVAHMIGRFNSDINVFASHIGNLLFKAQGYLDYEFQLSPQDKAMFEREGRPLAGMLAANGVTSLT